MAIFFDKLAVERLFRVVEGSPVVFLPVCLHQSAVRRECSQFFRHADHGGNGRECHINGQEDAGPCASGAEGVQKEECQEGVKHGGALNRSSLFITPIRKKKQHAIPPRVM